MVLKFYKDTPKGLERLGLRDGGRFVVLLMVVIFFLQHHVHAQIDPPALRCIASDSLSWEIPDIDCGGLEGFVIYRSNGIEGPYEVVDTIWDTTVNQYGASNPFGLVWYYYMSSLADCPGEMIVFSDTLSNLPLNSVPILSLSVADDGVLIEWEKSENSHIDIYVIYRNTAEGTVPIDTVYNQLQFLDMNADATSRSEIYYVLGMDDCGTKSFFDEPHNTILLDFDIQECEQQIDFVWNAYINWPGGVSSYVLWVADDRDSIFSPVDTISGSSLTTSFDHLVKNEEICFYISGIHVELEAESRSNTVCIVPDIVEPIRDLILLNACYDDLRNTLSVDWFMNETAELIAWEILAKPSENNNLISLQKVENPLEIMGLNQQEISLPAGFSLPAEIFIRTVDLCGKETTSSAQFPLLLDLKEQSETANVIGWDWVYPNNYEYLNREIRRTKLNGQLDIITLADNEEKSYSDAISATEPNDGRICYIKMVEAQIELPDGRLYDLSCTSNELCVIQEIKMYVPNAFRPGGVNDIFRPSILFLESIREYRLKIFDRWGQLLFESANPNNGWDGTVNGEMMNPDVFSYFIEIKSDTGIEMVKTGSIHLIR